MSVRFIQKLCSRYLLLTALLALAGLLIASFAVRSSSSELVKHFYLVPSEYFSGFDFRHLLLLLIKEFAPLICVYLFSRVSFGKIIACLLIGYKGFCIGTVASILSLQFGAVAVAYIYVLLAPPNIAYLLSLGLALQNAVSCSDGSRHSARPKVFEPLLLLSVIITLSGVLFEAFLAPLLYSAIF